MYLSPKFSGTERYGYQYMKKTHGISLWICALAILTVLYAPVCKVQAAPLVPYINYDSVSIEDTSITMTVSCSSTLLVRSGPGKSYDRIGSVNNGDQVQVSGICSNGWYRISFDNEDGYVYGDYLVASASDAVQETLADENATSDNSENPFLQWFSTLEFRTLLPLLIPVVIILILAVSAILLFRSIRRDTEYAKDEEYQEEEEDVKVRAVEDDELSNRVMRKTTPLPKIHSPQADPHMLDSEIRNFVVNDIGQYLDEDGEGDDPQLSALEEELEATQQHLLELQRQIERLKNHR